MGTPEHTLRLSYNRKRDRYSASYQEGKVFCRGHGTMPEDAIAGLLSKSREEGLEMEVRLFMSKIFDPWLRTLAKEHGIPMDAPQLEVKKSKLITPGEYITGK